MNKSFTAATKNQRTNQQAMLNRNKQLMNEIVMQGKQDARVKKEENRSQRNYSMQPKLKVNFSF